MEHFARSNCSGNISSIIVTKRIMKPFPPNIRPRRQAVMSRGSSQKNRNLLRFYYKRNSRPGLGYTDEQRMEEPN